MIGYGIGSLGQGLTYGFMSTYFVVFLTNSVGLSSSLATTISALALLVEVLAGMIIGNISDRCTSKMGKRRPFMMAAGLAVFPIFLFLFRSLTDETALRTIYYLVFAILFRTFFSSWEIPNQALGAELVSTYDGRTKLRTITRYFSVVGNGTGYIMPLLVLEAFGDNVQAGWWTIGILTGAISAVSWLTSVVVNKGKGEYLKPEDLPERTAKGIVVVKEILKSYSELIKLKVGKLLVGYKAAFTCAYAFYNVATIYFMTYSLGLSNKVTSYMYYITVAVYIVVTPLVNKMALRVGKVNQQLFSMALSGGVGVLVFIINPQSFVGVALYVAAFSYMTTSFWQVSSAIFYDVIEVDEWVNFKRREGDLVSMVSVLGTLISAIMVQAFGILMDKTGFDAALTAQPEHVVPFLNVSFILIPSVCLLIGAFVLKLFPINKKTFASLCSALEKRRNGEDYSEEMDDVNYILGKKQAEKEL